MAALDQYLSDLPGIVAAPTTLLPRPAALMARACHEAEGGDLANAGLQYASVFLEPVKVQHS